MVVEFLDKNNLRDYFVMTGSTENPSTLPMMGGTSGAHYGLTYDSNAWKVRKYDTEEKAYSLCEFYGKLSSH